MKTKRTKHQTSKYILISFFALELLIILFQEFDIITLEETYNYGIFLFFLVILLFVLRAVSEKETPSPDSKLNTKVVFLKGYIACMESVKDKGHNELYNDLYTEHLKITKELNL